MCRELKSLAQEGRDTLFVVVPDSRNGGGLDGVVSGSVALIGRLASATPNFDKPLRCLTARFDRFNVFLKYAADGQRYSL